VTSHRTLSQPRPIRNAAARLALGGLIALAVAIGIGRFVYTPILPPMMQALGLGKAAAGLIASANFRGYLVGALLAAWPGLKGARTRWLLGSLVASALTTGAMAAPDALLAFLILRFVGGVASAFVLVFATTLVLERLAGLRRMQLSAVHFAGVGTGIALSAALVAGLMAAGYSWRSLWLASGALSLVATFAWPY
jgi:MFS family permease